MFLYEIHIICVGGDPESIRSFAVQESGLWDCIGAIRPRLTHVINRYGDFPSQPMITTCIRSAFNELAISSALRIKEEMVSYGINGEYRVKVELQSSKAMPESVDSSPSETGAPQYYELHWDISGPGNLGSAGNYTPLFLDLEREAASHGVHLFFNCAKPKERQLPVATLRFFNCSREEARQGQRDVSRLLTEKGWMQKGSAEFEYSCYDDNVKFDNGWLHDIDPTNIYRTVPISA